MDPNTEDLQLDPVTDANGKELSDQDIIDAAERAEAVRFEYDGMKFMTYVRKINVSTKLWNRITTIQGKIAFKAGMRPGEDPGKMEDGDERLGTMMELMNESESLLEARADVALAATVKDSNGSLLTNVPILKMNNVTAADIVNQGELGEAYIKAVLEHLHPTSTPGEVATETTNSANDTTSLESLSSTSQENSPATG